MMGAIAGSRNREFMRLLLSDSIFLPCRFSSRCSNNELSKLSYLLPQFSVLAKSSSVLVFVNRSGCFPMNPVRFLHLRSGELLFQTKAIVLAVIYFHQKYTCHNFPSFCFDSPHAGLLMCVYLVKAFFLSNSFLCWMAALK